MLASRVFASTASLCLLAACGGGGGVSSTPPPPTGNPAPTPTPTPAPAPTPTPTPTPPSTNSDIGALVVDQDFAAQSGYTSTTFDLDTGAADTTAFSNRTIDISYDAASDSFTLDSRDGRTVNFAAADIVAAESEPGRTTYQRQLGQNEFERLLIFTQPTSGPANQSVAMGVWQSGNTQNNSQQSDLDVFVFGFDTPVAEIPLTGVLTYATDIYGVITYPDEEPRAIFSEGLGQFTLDLGRGVFSAHNQVVEQELRPGGGTSGALYFDATGRISSDANGFSGTFFYDGGGSRTFGQLDGSFFGPDAHEIGAVFSGVGNNGFTLNGGLTGQLDADSDAALAFAEQPRTFEVFSYGTNFSVTERKSDGDLSGGPRGNVVRMEYREDTIFMTSNSTALPVMEFALADADTTSLPGYRRWTGTIEDGDETFEVELALNEAGTGGVELTYSNFGFARWTNDGPLFVDRDTLYFHQGIATPRGVLLARTGTATYRGTVIGEAYNRDSGSQYAVGGTSLFQVDFGAQSIGGELALEGTRAGSSTSTDFGTWAIDGNISSNFGLPENITLAHETSPDDLIGSMEAIFYGPNAEEIGAEFQAVLPAGVLGEYLNIGGATVARQD